MAVFLPGITMIKVICSLQHQNDVTCIHAAPSLPHGNKPSNLKGKETHVRKRKIKTVSSMRSSPGQKINRGKKKLTIIASKVAVSGDVAVAVALAVAVAGRPPHTLEGNGCHFVIHSIEEI